MIDPATISQLAKLRNQIEQAQKTCDQTLNVMSSARDRAQALAATTPFLADCAKDLEALATPRCWTDPLACVNGVTPLSLGVAPPPI